MVATYDNLGVKFSYPENWRISEDQTNAWPRSVSVHSPTEAFWTLMIYEPGTELEALVDAVRDALSEEYTDFESVPAQQTIEGADLIGYDLSFYCLDFLVQAKIRALMLGVRPCVILYQGEDREFDEMELVFSAITHDLIRSQGNTGNGTFASTIIFLIGGSSIYDSQHEESLAMSISTDLHEDTMQKIGETSGQIWAYLSAEGPVSMTKLTKEVGEKKDTILLAVGWLARENKVFFFEKGRNKLIGLIDDHGPPEPQFLAGRLRQFATSSQIGR